MVIYKCCWCDNHLRPKGPFNTILVNGGARIPFVFDLAEPVTFQEVLQKHFSRAIGRR